jgi:tRNA(Arg) A34 adenosine deaminase TadA
MCAGAPVHVHIRCVIFGCTDASGGGAGSIMNLLQMPALITAAKLRPVSCKTNVRRFSKISFAKNARSVLASGEATDKEFRWPGFQIQKLE